MTAASLICLGIAAINFNEIIKNPSTKGWGVGFGFLFFIVFGLDWSLIVIEAIAIIIAAASVLYCTVYGAIAFRRFWKYGGYPYWFRKRP